MKIKKLYSNNGLFDPIEFSSGINFILGERVPEAKDATGRKTNGVGKSLCIEFVDYALLKNLSNSRISKIPKEHIPENSVIFLDLEINGNPIRIERLLRNNEPVVINNQSFLKLDDAQQYLTSLFFSNESIEVKTPSFRQMLAPLIREEESNFVDIIRCFKNQSIIDIVPHLYFFHVNIALYKEFENTLSVLAKSNTVKNDLEKKLTDNRNKKVSDVKAEYNALEDEVEKIKNAIDQLKTGAAFEAYQSQLITLENELNSLRIKQRSLKKKIKGIEQMPIAEEIDENEVALLYEKFRSGLGQSIKKSLEQVKQFQKKIQVFQHNLMSEELGNLKSELKEVNITLKYKEDTYTEILELIDTNGDALENLRNSILIYDDKQRKVAGLRALFKAYEAAVKEINRLKVERDQVLYKLSNSIDSDKRNNFEKTILSIHEALMGNKEASFNIYFDTKATLQKTNPAGYFKIDLRIDSDGSYSVNREKVFIYDVALMINEVTKKRHPQFLVHDNLFHDDDDTLIRSLNFLANLEESDYDFQYIITLNKERLEAEEDNLLVEIDSRSRAFFTKDKRFLKVKYKEAN